MLKEEKKVAIILLVPSVLIVALVYFYPTLYSFFMSLHNWKLSEIAMTKGATWVGLDNYILLLSDPIFHNSVRVSFYTVAVSIGISFLLGLAMALLVNEQFKGRGILRGIFLIPWVMAPVVVGLTQKWIYNHTYGALNSLLLQTGIISSSIPWLANPLTAIHTLIFIDIWQYTPFMMMILLAGLQGVPIDLYKAAKVDGANTWGRFRHVTVPLIKPSIASAVFIRTADAFRLFDLVYVMTAGGPVGSTRVLAYHSYKEAFAYGNFAVGSAIGFYITIFSLIATVILYYTLIRKRDGK